MRGLLAGLTSSLLLVLTGLAMGGLRLPAWVAVVPVVVLGLTGAGLGLSICMGVAKSHGGTIRCESELGAGTTMIAELPLPSAAGE